MLFPHLHKALILVRHFMRVIKFISLFFVLACLVGLRLAPRSILIKGHLKRNPVDTSFYVEYLFIMLKGDNNLLAKTISNEKGDFSVSLTPNGERSFDLYCTQIGIDTLLIGSFRLFESDTLDMSFYVPKKIDKNAFGKVLCPKCNRADKVYPITHNISPCYCITHHESWRHNLQPYPSRNISGQLRRWTS